MPKKTWCYSDATIHILLRRWWQRIEGLKIPCEWIMTCRKRCPRFHWGTLYPFPFETSRDSGLFGTKKISSKRDVWMSFYDDQRIIDGVVWIGTFHGTFGRLHSATRGMQYGSILQLNLFFPNGSFEKRFALIGQILEMGESFELPYVLSTFPSTFSPPFHCVLIVKEPYSLVLLKLHTGRTHQIRFLSKGRGGA